METNILMESGTNELEVLEFMVGGNHYGINVAKIKEIVPYTPITPVPNSHPNVEGIFMPRDLMITVIDLAKVIKSKPSDDITKDSLFSLLSEFELLDAIEVLLAFSSSLWQEDKAIAPPNIIAAPPKPTIFLAFFVLNILNTFS